MPEHVIILHRISPDWDEAEDPRHRLDEAERTRADRFVFPADARRWMIFRAKAKRILAGCHGGPESPWLDGPGGKPRIDVPGLEFNLSHSDRLAVLAVSRHGPVGVDLEPWDRADGLAECAGSFCHPAELDDLPAAPGARGRRLLELWTAKEAFLKAIGTGLGFPPTELRLHDDRVVEGPDECLPLRLRRPPFPGGEDHCLAVVVPPGTQAVRFA